MKSLEAIPINESSMFLPDSPFSIMVRQIILDDTNEKIQYTGPGWFLDDTGSHDGVGLYGATYLRTLHGTNSNGTLAFDFEGTSIAVRGTFDLTKIQPAGPNLSWKCFIDGINIPISSPPELSQNNGDLCNTQDLVEGPHELIIQARTNDQTFWVDYILYSPSPNSSLEDAVVVVENIDPDITYDSSWRGEGNGNMTQTNGSTARFRFVGTSLSWIGFSPNEFPHAASFATYSIDESFPTSFQLSGLPPGTNDTLFHQTFFTTPELRAGLHNLLVTYHGTDQQTPLTLDYLHITTHSTSNLRSAPTATPVGIIVGATVGGVVVVTFCLCFFWLYQKRRAGVYLERNTDKSSSDLTAYPFLRFALPQRATVKSDRTTSADAASSDESTRVQQGTPTLSPRSAATLMNPNQSRAHSKLRGQRDSVLVRAEEVRSPQELDEARLIPRRPVLHQDSGWRMREESLASIEDVPPRYTLT